MNYGLIFFLSLVIGLLLMFIFSLRRKNSILNKEYDKLETQLKQLNAEETSRKLEKLKNLESRYKDAYKLINDLESLNKSKVDRLVSFKEIMITKFVWPKDLHQQKERIMDGLFQDIENVLLFEHNEVDKVLIGFLQDKIHAFKRGLPKVSLNEAGNDTIIIEFLRLAMVTFDVVEYLNNNVNYMNYEGFNVANILKEIRTDDMSPDGKEKIKNLLDGVRENNPRKVSKFLSDKQEIWAFVMNKMLSDWIKQMPEDSKPLIYSGYQFLE